MGRFRRALGRVIGRRRDGPPANPVKPQPVAAPSPEPTPVTGHRLASADDLKALIAETPVLVLHHWAVWCDSCIEELPHIDTLATTLDGEVPVLGVSWEAFMGHDSPRDALAETQRFAAARDSLWPSWVVQDDPEDFFEAMGLPVRTVPQTAVYRDGERVAVWPAPLGAVDLLEVVAAAG